MFILAEHLGHVHKEFQHCTDVMKQSSDSVNASNSVDEYR